MNSYESIQESIRRCMVTQQDPMYAIAKELDKILFYIDQLAYSIEDIEKKMSDTRNKTTCSEDNQQVKLETLSQIAAFVKNGGGSFRSLAEDYLFLNYTDAYRAGGMIITNAINPIDFEKNNNTMGAIAREFDTIHTMLDGIQLRLDNLEEK